MTHLIDWSVSLMEIIGPAGAGLAIALENIFPPLPSEVILPMAGLSASRGSFSLAEALIWTTLGSVMGAFLLYGIGAWLGVDRLRTIAAKVPLLRPDDIDRTVAWFHRHGGKAVFFGRMVPIFRSLISIPAGVHRHRRGADRRRLVPLRSDTWPPGLPLQRPGAVGRLSGEGSQPPQSEPPRRLGECPLTVSISCVMGRSSTRIGSCTDVSPGTG